MRNTFARSLQLADVVSYSHTMQGEYECMTVTQIKDGIITLRRPYIVTADFSYTGGVCWSVGIEEVSIEVDSSIVFYVWSRKTLK